MIELNSKYFNLNPESYLIVGNKKAVIHNLLTKDILWIDEKNTSLIVESEKGIPIDIKEVFCYLERISRR